MQPPHTVLVHISIGIHHRVSLLHLDLINLPLVKHEPRTLRHHTKDPVSVFGSLVGSIHGVLELLVGRLPIGIIPFARFLGLEEDERHELDALSAFEQLANSEVCFALPVIEFLSWTLSLALRVKASGRPTGRIA